MKVSLKLNIKKIKIMSSGPITSWQIDGETVETVSDFIFGNISCLCIYNFSKFGRIEIVPKNPDLWLLEKSDDFAT